MSDTRERLITLKEAFYFLHIQRGGGIPQHAGPHGEAPVSVWMKERVRGRQRLRPLPCFPWTKLSRWSSLGLASLNNSVGFGA